MQNDTQANPNGQGVEPNYSFINEYDTPPPKKKMNIKVVIIVVGLILTVILAIIGSVLGSRDEQAARTVNSGESSTFVTKVLANETTAAYAMLSPGMKAQYDTEDKFSRQLADGIRQTLSGDTCTLVGTDRAKDTDSFIHRCDVEDTVFWVGLGVSNLGQPEEMVHRVCPITREELTECR